MMHRQASQSQRETAKHFHNCNKVLSQFVHRTVQTCGSIVRGRSEAVRMTTHRYQAYNFGFLVLRQKNVTAYNIEAVC